MNRIASLVLASSLLFATTAGLAFASSAVDDFGLHAPVTDQVEQCAPVDNGLALSAMSFEVIFACDDAALVAEDLDVLCPTREAIAPALTVALALAWPEPRCDALGPAPPG